MNFGIGCLRYSRIRETQLCLLFRNGTFHEIDICAKNEPPRQVPAPVVQQVAPVPRPLAKVESQNTMEEQIEIHASYLRCMIDDTSGVLKFDSGGSVEKFCYFEFSDLNIEKPHQLLDIVMILNRMNGIRVQFQGRLVNAKNKIQYVAHLNGVQVVGKLPNFMSGIKLKSNPVSRIQAGLNGEKVQRYKKANEMFESGKFKSISDVLSSTRRGNDYVQGIGYIKQLLNENFGIVEIGKDFALFDTFDLYIKDGVTAADTNKKVGDVLKVNDKVRLKHTVRNLHFLSKNSTLISREKLSNCFG